MSNPYLKKRGNSPPPKTSFQRELDQTMRERSKRGLAADVSSNDSDDDGIEDDNELLGDFAATMKPKPRSYLRNADPMNMTLKEPLRPLGSKRISSPPLSHGKGQKLGSMGEEDEDLSEDSDDEPKKQRPSFLRSHVSKEPVLQRPKSPSIHGRKKSAVDFDEVDAIPVARKRSVAPIVDLEERKTASGRSTPRSTKSPSISGKPSEDNLSKMFSSERQTPTEHRKSPFNNRMSPIGDREMHSDSRKTPIIGHKSPKPHEELRRTPVEGHKSPKLFGDNRRTPVDGYKSPKPHEELRRTPVEGHKSPKVFENNRRTPVDGHSSPKSNAEHRRTPVRNHKSPESFDEGRRTPTKDRKSPGPHLLKKKSSVLDFLEESSSVTRAGRDSSDDEELRKVADGQKKKTSSTPEFISVKIDGTVWKDERSDSKVNRRLSDDESSVFVEKLEEPVHQKEANTPPSTTHKGKVKVVRIQRTGKKAADEAIDVLTDAQNGTNKMKYIDPVKNEAFKSQPSVKKRSASSSRIFKPKAIYSGSGTLSRTSGSSMEALNFDSTKDIRQVVYEVWKVQATERMKQTFKEKKEKEKELEEKKRKEKEEKILESLTTYNAWMDKKKGFVSTKTIQAKKEEEKKREEELKKKERKKDAEVLFVKWKETQDVVLKEKYREKLKAVKREERKKEEAKREKEREAESAFRKWNENKNDHLQNLKKEELRRAREKKEHEERERQEQQRSARDLYEKWLEKKERQEVATQRKKQFDSDEEDGRRPWRPSSMKISHIR